MSSGNGILSLSEPMQDLFDYFHSFMYAEIYTNPLAKGEEGKVDGILAALYDYYTGHPETLPEDYLGILEHEGVERAACDYISGMTDGYAMEKYSELFIPFAWTVK